MTIQWRLPENFYNMNFSNPFANVNLLGVPKVSINLPTPILPTFGLSDYTTSSCNNNSQESKSIFSSATGKSNGSITSIARSYIGDKESDNSYLKFTNGRREAWCADFVSYCARQSGLNGFNFRSVEGIRQWGIQNGKYKRTPQVGDAIILKNGMSHTGIVDSINTAQNTITITEGNSSDRVKQVTYSLDDRRISGYVTLA